MSTTRIMIQPLSNYSYRSFTTDPDVLDVPIEFNLAPLPRMIEPSSQPDCLLSSLLDYEPLVKINDRRIRLLSPYWHVGWNNAISDTLVRSGVADALRRAAHGLPDGFGLAVLDGWRPLTLQQEIFNSAYNDPTLPVGFVSMPSNDFRIPPPHLTGGTVDVTLTWDNHPLALGTSFDDFSNRARVDYFENKPGKIRSLRRLLYWAMQKEGFVVIDCEWWHFELGTRRAAAIKNLPVLYGKANLPIS